MRVIIVGAGVLGASIAFHAAAAGADVVLVDAAHEGRATAAGAGIVCPWAGEKDRAGKYRIATAAARYYPTLIEKLAEAGEHDTGYKRVGALIVSADAAELDAIGRALRSRAEADPAAGAIERLSPELAREKFPPLRRDLGAVRIAGGARVDGRLLTAALLRAAQSAGAELRRATAELACSDSRAAVHVAGEPIPADIVVVAAGAWAPLVLRPIGLVLPVAPQRGQIVHLRVPDTETAEWPVILPPGSHYLLAFEDGRVVVGATRETGSGFDYRVTAAGLTEVLSEALAVAPGLGSASILETRIGFRPIAPDGRPLLGAAPGISNLLIGNGLGPSGLTIGPYAGKLLAQLALGQAPDLDLAPYAPPG